MAKRWQMLRCECGQAFGASSSGSPSCTRCGSSRVRRVRSFDEPSELSEAVALANAPKEVQQEISKRSRDAGAPRAGGKPTPSQMLAMMKEATSEDGTLSLESLQQRLDAAGVDEPSASHLVGLAEVEGELLRSGPNTWVWL